MADAEPDVIRELHDIERQLAATWKTGDCNGWAAFIAPEWSVTHIAGNIITRDQALEMCRSGEVRIAEMSIDDLSVRLFGDTAVVTGRTAATTAGAAPESVTLRFTDVFVKRAGHWQVVASHATRILA